MSNEDRIKFEEALHRADKSGGRSGDGFVVKSQATPQAEEAHQES